MTTAPILDSSALANSMLDSMFAAATVNPGLWAPTPGNHEVYVTAVHAENQVFAEGKKGEADRIEYDGMTIWFEYQLMEDPGSPQRPRTILGSKYAITLPLLQPGQSFRKETTQTRVKIALEKLKTAACAILGVDPDALPQSIEQVVNLMHTRISEGVAAGNPPGVILTYRASKGGKAGFLDESITGSIPTTASV